MAVCNLKCPKCGGNLVLRTGRYGQFHGCSNYPNCKFTTK
ncbi:MAG: topoisomerase DNA-binding C4 zinc finger domain-containing protein [Bacteroidales bacterium]|nr:topoisomerase DNA-binding C4 zinc finger domain-containing protein [Bacteroidales bacterium]